MAADRLLLPRGLPLPGIVLVTGSILVGSTNKLERLVSDR